MTRQDPGETRLAVYGSLAPGRPNHHQLSDLQGEWRAGSVRGRLVAEGWGAQLGFPGLVLDPEGDEIEVQVLASPDLPHHWARLDAFEGDGYRRVTARVAMEDGEISAWVYVVA